MNQFKDLLLGNEERDYQRATSVQKCIRAGGKHNDLDDVGKDGRHLTFFEMLGNWSFGDYYKRDAIAWAWEYVTEELELSVERLYVTVYSDDDESRDIWIDEIGVDAERVLRLGDVDEGDEENFWSMGPTGPCGPCTEIHYDLHPERDPIVFEKGYDEDRIVEIWNLVFMEFNRDETGEFHPLPMKSVDTGMGLDRVAMILAGADSVFHTELFSPIFERTAELLGESILVWEDFYGDERFSDFAVIADHIRTVTFALCDGAQFSNEGRGNVLRRILRRAVRHGYNLGFEDPFLHDLTEVVLEHYGAIYPELDAVGDKAAHLIKLEEERFWRNLERGFELFEQAVDQAREEGRDELTGEQVFELHATYGFPPDLTEIMAAERDLGVDLHGYEKRRKEHQDISNARDVYADAAGVGDWTTVEEGPADTFVGYDRLEAETTVRKYRSLDEDRFELLLAHTPFYAESGGQVGDRGQIVRADGDLSFEVDDTVKTPIGIVHRARLASGTVEGPESFEGGFEARVDAGRRRATMCNHTATHLLHAALREEIDESIFQSGSLVAPDRLRFDFSYNAALDRDQLRLIEDRVNDRIRRHEPVVVHQEVERDRAVEQMGATAIFEEKYGDRVRVVEIPGESVELCGGTHVDNTSDINLFRIVGESSVAAGIRRIEAVTNEGAYRSFQDEREQLRRVVDSVKSSPSNVVERIDALVEERSELEREVRRLSQKLAARGADQIVDEATRIEGVAVLAERLEVTSRDQMLDYADRLREKMEMGAVLLGAEIDGKPALLCLVTEEAVEARGLRAGDLINEAASHIDGRGGGRPTLAQAGGGDVEGLGDALGEFDAIVRRALEG
jgi:alanyl-tRNA synthetase